MAKQIIRVQPHVRRPRRDNPVELYKESDTPQVIALFNQIVNQVRKELRQQSRLAVSALMVGSQMNHVTFVSDNVSVTVNLKR
ncbi:MAG: hypothetical protein Q7J05_04075 [Paludibacter sp.]|nr:hypothetical protein [Paludibacter sp.]